jgi:CRP-like cAMP-binding protein
MYSWWSGHRDPTGVDAVLEDVGTLKRYKDGAVVFRENDRGSHMYVIRSGTVVLTRTNQREGHDIVTTLAELGRNDFFGEMALFDYGRRSATATARGDVELMEISRKDLQRKTESDPQVPLFFLDQMSRRMRKADEMIESLLVRQELTHEVYERVDALRYPGHLQA